MPEKHNSMFRLAAKARETELMISLTHLSTVSLSNGLSKDTDAKFKGRTGIEPERRYKFQIKKRPKLRKRFIK